MDVISYKKAKRAEELAEQIIEGSIETGVLQTNINQKLNDLEVQYAPDLTNVKSQLADLVKQGNLPNKLLNQLKTNTYNEKAIHIIGDSISQGANAPDIPNDSWVGIMKKFLNVSFNVNNYGFTNLLDKISNGLGDYQDIHQLISSTNWTATLYVHDYIGLSRYSTTTVGAKLQYKLKKHHKYCKIFYEQSGADNSFKVNIGTTTLATITASGATDKFKCTAYIDISVYPEGSIIEIEKVGVDQLTICGIGYYNSNSADTVIVNNFARSGAKLSLIPDDVLNVMCNTKFAFFALGHNDNADAAITLEQFQTKLNYCKDKFLTNGTFVVVMDFIWANTSNTYKAALKQFAKDVNGLYIDHLFESFNSTPTTVQSAGYLTDASHPSVLGHRIIAESTAKRLGLGVSSKTIASKLASENWIPVTLGNGWVNVLNYAPYHAKYRKEGNMVHIQMLISSGTYNTPIFTLPVGLRPIQTIKVFQDMNDSTSKIFYVQIRDNGEVALRTNDTIAFTNHYVTVSFPLY